MAKSTPSEWGRVLTPERLLEYGALDTPIPEAPFDPEGDWTQTWRVWLLKRNARDMNHRGYILLKRKPDTDHSSFNIEVDQAHIQTAQASVHETLARISCLANPLSTPRSWEIQTRLIDVKENREITSAATHKSGSLVDGKMKVECNNRTSLRSIPVGSVSSNWTILEALQRTMKPRETTYRFTFLDELDKIKPKHRLCHRKYTKVNFGSKTHSAHCYQQIGQGALPWLYYIDEKTSRLLLAINGLRAYILDSNTVKDHKTIVARLGRRK